MFRVKVFADINKLCRKSSPTHYSRRKLPLIIQGPWGSAYEFGGRYSHRLMVETTGLDVTDFGSCDE